MLAVNHIVYTAYILLVPIITHLHLVPTIIMQGIVVFIQVSI